QHEEQGGKENDCRDRHCPGGHGTEKSAHDGIAAQMWVNSALDTRASTGRRVEAGLEKPSTLRDGVRFHINGDRLILGRVALLDFGVRGWHELSRYGNSALGAAGEKNQAKAGREPEQTGEGHVLALVRAVGEARSASRPAPGGVCPSHRASYCSRLNGVLFVQWKAKERVWVLDIKLRIGRVLPSQKANIVLLGCGPPQ